VFTRDIAVPGGTDGSDGAAGASGDTPLPVETVSFALDEGDGDVLVTIETPYIETTVLEAASAVIDDLAITD
jgi:hypothetical protein